MSTSNEILETASPVGGQTAARRPVLLAVSFAAVVILAHLPLFLLHLRNLWVMRPHYQFFPLLLAGIGVSSRQVCKIQNLIILGG